MFLYAYNKGKVKVNHEDYENVIARFFKKNDKEQQNILCLGILIKPGWVFVTIDGLMNLKPFAETIAVIGRNILISNLCGVQRLHSRSKFTIVVVSSFSTLIIQISFHVTTFEGQ